MRNYIYDSYTTGEIKSDSYGVGGFVGLVNINSILNISNSYTTADVETKAHSVGGLLGSVARSSIANISSSYVGSNIKSKSRYAGGVIGRTESSSCVVITDSYTTGNVSGKLDIGDFIGHNEPDCELTITNSYSTGSVNGSIGSFIGSDNGTTTIDALSGQINSTQLNTLIKQGSLPSFNNGINLTLQVGINSDTSSSIETEFWVSLAGLDYIARNPNSAKSLVIIDELIAELSAKQVELGASSNRLMSALDEISTQYENLVSSRSTLRDADIAEVSSTYIQQQILQQASATLLATANQSAGIALQLL